MPTFKVNANRPGDGFIPKPFNAQSLTQTLIRTGANAQAGLQEVLP